MLENSRILIVAPHPDDETIGAGGAIAKYIKMGCEIFVLIISGHLPPVYKKGVYEGTELEAKKAFKILGVNNYKFLKIPATMISDVPIHILNKKILDIVCEYNPSVVLFPYPDRMIDHRLIFDSVMVVTRPVGIAKNIKLLATYETLSETHWNAPHIEPNFTPNLTIDITDNIQDKLKALGCYKSQIPDFPGARSLEAVEALAKFRGTQSGFKYGEALQIIRMII